ncbi:PAS domain S-box protein [Haloparvum sp. AD34]
MNEAVRILHVDDDPAFADLVATYLERESDRFEVLTEPGPDAALDRLDEVNVDCVVSDYDMPECNGIEFLTTVREESPDLPFILFTGKGSEAVASDAISAGVTDYIQKGPGTDQYELLANRITNAVVSRRSREALTERTRELETLVSNLPGMVYRCENDLVWTMNEVKGDAAELTGYTAAEIESDDLTFGTDLIHPADRDDVVADVQAGISEADEFETTYRLRTKDGSTKWVWERGQTVGASGDEVLEGFITDITDLKQHEQKLERYERIVENLPVGIFRASSDGGIVSANATLVDMLGADSREELLATDPTRLWGTPDDGEGLIEEITRTGGLEETVVEATTLDGETRLLEVRVALSEEDGERHFDVSVRDVTAERRRERTADIYEKVFRNTNDAVFVLDPDADRIVDANPAAAEFTGYSQAELRSDVAISDVHPGEMTEFHSFIETVLAEGGTVTDEFACLTSDGERRPAEISAAPIDGGVDGDGNVDGTGNEESGHVVATVRELRDR